MKAIKTFITLLFIAALTASMATSYYFYQKYQDSQAIVNNPQAAAAEEVKALTTKLGELMDLPQDEEPTLATVLEKDKLADQPFFAKAENGDKVFIYAKSLKAILYRPSINKIIEFAPITMQPEPTQKPEAETVAEPSVEPSPEE